MSLHFHPWKQLNLRHQKHLIKDCHRSPFCHFGDGIKSIRKKSNTAVLWTMNFLSVWWHHRCLVSYRLCTVLANFLPAHVASWQSARELSPFSALLPVPRETGSKAPWTFTWTLTSLQEGNSACVCVCNCNSLLVVQSWHTKNTIVNIFRATFNVYMSSMAC